MKKIVLIFLFLTSFVSASEVQWQKDLVAAKANATKVDKPILFVSSRHTCKYCVMLERTTFGDPRVIKALNEDFISFTSWSDEGDVVPQELWRPGTPAIWFLLPNGSPMYEPLMGAVGPEDFLQALSIVREEYNKNYKKKSKNDFYKLKK